MMAGEKSRMKWPVNRTERNIPSKSETGGFLEDRTDRKHCGIDIYAPKNTAVVAIESGIVLSTEVFTSPNLISYWYKTFQIIVKAKSGLFYRYAELEDTCVKVDEDIKEGVILGHVGRVLNTERIDSSSPAYIQRLKKKNHDCMLHLELYDSKPEKSDKYLGGNWFGTDKPKHIINPAEILKKIR